MRTNREAASWVVHCGCGTVYRTECPMILVCPNAGCSWDFGPGLDRCPDAVPRAVLEAWAPGSPNSPGD